MVGKVTHSTLTSYLVDFEDVGHSVIAKMKVQRADRSLEDTKDNSSDKADEMSFQIVKNVNTTKLIVFFKVPQCWARTV